MGETTLIHETQMPGAAGGGTLRPLLPWRAALRAAARPWVLVLAAVALGLGAFGVVYANWEMLGGGASQHSIQGVDDTGYYIWLRSAVIDGDWDFENDIREAPTLESTMRDEWLAWPRTAAGRVPNKYPPGWALLTAPAFLAAHAVAGFLGAEANGWSAPYFCAVWIYHLALAALGLWWAWRVVSRFVREDLAAASVLALWIASPVIYYHTARVSMVHGVLFTLVAGLTHCTLCAQEHLTAGARSSSSSPRVLWLTIGVLGGLAVLVRSTAAVYLLHPAVVLIASLRDPSSRSAGWRNAVALVVPGVLAGALLLASNRVVLGSFLADPYATEALNWLRPAVRESLFSPLHGLFYWHPLILLGLAGLAWAMAMRRVPRTWALSLVAISYINSAWQAWWFGSSYGNRAYESVVLFAMVGLGWLWTRAAEARASRAWTAALTVIVGLAITGAGVWLVLFIVQAIPREAAVTYADLWAALAHVVTGGQPLP